MKKYVIKKGFHWKLMNDNKCGIYLPHIGKEFSTDSIIRQTDKALFVELSFKRGTDSYMGCAGFWIPKSCVTEV